MSVDGDLLQTRSSLEEIFSLQSADSPNSLSGVVGVAELVAALPARTEAGFQRAWQDVL